jgi:iron-sulfur cluster repair protein YtfE (RIC family)
MPATALTVLHKYIRRELFDMSQQLFRACPTRVHTIRAALADVGALLEQHAAQEELRLAPLLRDVDPAIETALAQQHAHLERMLHEVVAAAAAIDGSGAECEERLRELQLDWDRFVGHYLLHLDAEERTWFPLLVTGVHPVSYLREVALAMGEPRGQEFLLKLWAVVTPSELAQIDPPRAVRSVA